MTDHIPIVKRAHSPIEPKTGLLMMAFNTRY